MTALFRSHFHQGKLYSFRQLVAVSSLLVALALLAGRPVALAQSADGATLPIQRLRIQVMPEFDDPRVLVIVQGRLAVADDLFPLPITFRLPAGALVNQMAGIDMSSGRTAAQEFSLLPDPSSPDWVLATFSLPSAHFFYEYYYDPLPAQSDKAFSFLLDSLHPVEDLVIEVQQPLAASNFSLLPPADETRLDESFGFTYHRLVLGALPAGQPVAVAVRYTKSDPDPSLSREQLLGTSEPVAAGSDSTAPTPGAAEPIPTWVLILVAAIVLLTIASIVWNRLRPAPPGGLVRPAFCIRCGAPLKPDAHFCHVCGVAQSTPRVDHSVVSPDGPAR